ncbi:MAG: hypothetical protein D6723_11690 [Acidobacteria bacterium]|nr:MAG: hypothetical protein D6723_11690 [Acidobacteriota bacterium]
MRLAERAVECWARRENENTWRKSQLMPLSIFEGALHDVESHTEGMKRARWRILAFSAPLR